MAEKDGEPIGQEFDGLIESPEGSVLGGRDFWYDSVDDDRNDNSDRVDTILDEGEADADLKD